MKNNINTLAWKLVDYTKDTDPYEFNDSYSSEEDAFNHFKSDLSKNSTTSSLIEMLCSEINYYAEERDLTDNDTLKDFNRAVDLLKDVSIFYQTLEEDLEL